MQWFVNTWDYVVLPKRKKTLRDITEGKGDREMVRQRVG